MRGLSIRWSAGMTNVSRWTRVGQESLWWLSTAATLLGEEAFEIQSDLLLAGMQFHSPSDLLRCGLLPKVERVVVVEELRRRDAGIEARVPGLAGDGIVKLELSEPHLVDVLPRPARAERLAVPADLLVLERLFVGEFHADLHGGYKGCDETKRHASRAKEGKFTINPKQDACDWNIHWAF